MQKYNNMRKIIMRRSSLFFAAAAVFMLASCGRRSETIWIISTNDMHGAIEKMPNLATLVGEYRAQDTASVFLVDAGDRWTGNPYVDMAPQPGKPIIELMNELGYDVATFGNHEFDRGQALLDERTQEAMFPVVLANMHTTISSPLSQPMPYHKLKSRRGTDITILGLITNFIDGHPDGTGEVYEGLVFQSPYETAETYSWLRGHTDVFIALTHIGNDADTVLAREVPVFDLVIGGHTHAVIEEPYVIDGTYVTQTGKSLKYAGVTRLTMRGKKLQSVENHLVRLDTVAADARYAGLIEKYYDNEELNRPIGSLAAEAGRDAIINMVTDVSRANTGADFAFYHTGGIRVNDMPAGPVSKGDMFAIEPFASAMVTVDMTLPEIRRMIINKFNDTQNPKESHHEDIYPSGMNYTVITDERGEAVDVIFDHRYYPERDKKYRVAMSDYMYKMYKFDKPEIIATSPLITDMLIGYFGSGKPVAPDGRARITIRMR